MDAVAPRFARLLMAAVLTAFAICSVYGALAQRHSRTEHPGLPFGVTRDDEGGRYFLNDFATHFHFCQAIWKQVHARPYSLEGQEAIFHDWVPELQAGMPFAYSPSLVVLARPFVGMPPSWAFGLFSALGAVLVALLIRGFVQPRLGSGWQMAQAAAAVFSLSGLSTFWIGQTSLLSTVLLGFSWLLLSREKRTAFCEGLLGAALWILSAKPSVGLLLVCWLLAFRAWRAVGIGLALCGLSCAAAAPVLGGWPDWWRDYLFLLSHYHQDGIGAFMSPGLPPRILTSLFGFLVQGGGMPEASAASLCRNLWLGGLAVLAALFFARRIGAPSFLRLSVVGFLVFCPHVSATEDWLLVLAVLAEKEKPAPVHGLWIFLLVFAAVNLRQGFPWEGVALALPAKLLLLGIWMARAFRKRRTDGSEGGKIEGLPDDVAARA